MEILTKQNGKTQILFCEDYYSNPAMKNEFRTIFFECKVHTLELVEKELMGYVVEEEAKFLVVHMSIKNITNEILDMYREDFMILFDQEGPFYPENYFQLKYQFEDVYALKPQEEKKGCLVFLISTKTKQITLQFIECFEDEEEGKTYKLKYKLK